MVRLLGAVDVVSFAGCHFSVLGVRRVTANFGGGAIAGAIVVCYGWGEVTTTFGGVDVVPLLGAIAGCQFLFHIFLLYSGPPISPRHPRKQQ